MKNTLKRHLALLLALCALCMAVPSFAAAADALSFIPAEATYYGGHNVIFSSYNATHMLEAIFVDGVRVPGGLAQPGEIDEDYIEVLGTGAPATIVFKPKYLNTLSQGAHTVEFHTIRGKATVLLTVNTSGTANPPADGAGAADGFAESAGKVTAAARVYALDEGMELGRLKKNAKINVVGLTGTHALIDYPIASDGPIDRMRQVALVEARYVECAFAEPVYGTTNAEAPGYKARKAKKKYDINFTRAGIRVKLTGLYGNWYKVEYKEKSYYVQTQLIDLPF